MTTKAANEVEGLPEINMHMTSTTPGNRSNRQGYPQTPEATSPLGVPADLDRPVRDAHRAAGATPSVSRSALPRECHCPEWAIRCCHLSLFEFGWLVDRTLINYVRQEARYERPRYRAALYWPNPDTSSRFPQIPEWFYTGDDLDAAIAAFGEAEEKLLAVAS